MSVFAVSGHSGKSDSFQPPAGEEGEAYERIMQVYYKLEFIFTFLAFMPCDNVMLSRAERSDKTTSR